MADEKIKVPIEEVESLDDVEIEEKEEAPTGADKRRKENVLLGNLGKPYLFTSETAKEASKKGAKAIWENAKAKKTVREEAIRLANLKYKGKNLDNIKQLGIAKGDVTNRLAMVVALFNKGLKGDTTAISKFIDILGETDDDKSRDGVTINLILPKDEDTED